MKNPTSTEIASDFDLWGEYVDPHATMSEEEFDDGTVEERLTIIRELFPQNCED